ncbi:DNA internalization-related competence protein ComEC/Rec2 [Weissella viridescens]|uniref:DNA internalization-related competence protein ComEC/Rec2 n=1 Tax=Weissella viridescens TaxID=1629 RepID=A0A3P2RE02_WEIVI|nr:DNA internalization-related competence protein ComEC/Rec2 [Weissella viridescens]RRG17391.1 DNA internalization-related competence protein ComEC/Rec2 [Weissella viridescens]
MTYIWFLLGLAGIALNLICLTGQYWGVIPLVYVCLVLCFYHVSTWKRLITVLLICCGYWLLYRHSVEAPLKYVTGSAQIKTVLTHMDHCQLSEQSLSGTGKIAISGESVKFRVRHLTESDINQIKKYDGSLEIKAAYTYQRITGPRNRFEFDMQHYWFSRGIVCQLMTNTPIMIHRVQPSIWTIDGIVSLVRSNHVRLVAWFEKLPHGLRDYAETLLLGYVRPDFYLDNQGLSQLGLIHLFSISGFQVHLVCQSWYFLCRRLNFLKEFRLWSSQLVLGFFWIFAGDNRSLIRSVVAMGTDHFVQLKNYRWTRFDIWGMTILLSLLLEPGLLCHLGGQLSCLLSFGLLWVRQLKWWQVSMMLNVLILPLLIWNTFTWHPISVLCNLVVIPCFTYLICPLVIVGVLAQILHLSPMVALIDGIMTLLQNGFAMVAKCPGEICLGQPNPICFGLLAIVTLICIIYRDCRWWRALAVGYVLILFLGGMRTTDHIVFFDVGQGDATFFKLDTNETILVDVGGKVSFNQNQRQRTRQAIYGAWPILNYLKAQGIQTIDLLVLTHKDMDHIGNLEGILRSLKVHKIVVPVGMQLSQRLLRMSPHTQVSSVKAGDALLPGLQILAPDHVGRGENADSIALNVKSHGLSMVLTGDLDQAGEERIVKQFEMMPVDILKLGHHGSKTSTGRPFLKTLKPQIGIVSAGVDNRFGHPHAEVVERLKQHNVQMYQTQECGMIRVRKPQGNLQIDFTLNPVR